MASQLAVAGPARPLTSAAAASVVITLDPHASVTRTCVNKECPSHTSIGEEFETHLDGEGHVCLTCACRQPDGAELVMGTNSLTEQQRDDAAQIEAVRTRSKRKRDTGSGATSGVHEDLELTMALNERKRALTELNNKLRLLKRQAAEHVDRLAPRDDVLSATELRESRNYIYKEMLPAVSAKLISINSRREALTLVNDAMRAVTDTCNVKLQPVQANKYTVQLAVKSNAEPFAELDEADIVWEEDAEEFVRELVSDLHEHAAKCINAAFAKSASVSKMRSALIKDALKTAHVDDQHCTLGMVRSTTVAEVKRELMELKNQQQTGLSGWLPMVKPTAGVMQDNDDEHDCMNRLDITAVLQSAEHAQATVQRMLSGLRVVSDVLYPRLRDVFQYIYRVFIVQLIPASRQELRAGGITQEALADFSANGTMQHWFNHALVLLFCYKQVVKLGGEQGAQMRNVELYGMHAIIAASWHTHYPLFWEQGVSILQHYMCSKSVQAQEAVSQRAYVHHKAGALAEAGVVQPPPLVVRAAAGPAKLRAKGQNDVLLKFCNVVGARVDYAVCVKHTAEYCMRQIRSDFDAGSMQQVYKPIRARLAQLHELVQKQFRISSQPGSPEQPAGGPVSHVQAALGMYECGNKAEPRIWHFSVSVTAVACLRIAAGQFQFELPEDESQHVNYDVRTRKDPALLARKRVTSSGSSAKLVVGRFAEVAGLKEQSAKITLCMRMLEDMWKRSKESTARL